MPSSRGRVSRLGSRLLLLAASLAAIAQLVLVVAPLIEGESGMGMAAHVESRGHPSHHAHEESRCVACQVRTLHLVAARGPVLPPLPHAVAVVATGPARVAASADLVSPVLPRAPPC